MRREALSALVFFAGVSSALLASVILKPRAEKPLTAQLREEKGGSYRQPSSTRPNIPLKELPVDLLERKFSRALAAGTPEELRILEPETLSSIPAYPGKLASAINAAALVALIVRFTDVDYESWPRSDTALGGGPTAARNYIDSVTTVNRDLGRYLESAAVLIHILYLRTHEGKVFDADTEFAKVETNPEAFWTHDVAGQSLLDRWDHQALEDPILVAALEEQRAVLVVRYVVSHAQNYQRTIILLLSVDASVKAVKQVSTQLRAELHRAALEGSPRFREWILRTLLNTASAKKWITEDRLVRRAVGELYLAAVVDSIELNNPEQARSYLRQSKELAPGLKAQQLLENAVVEISKAERGATESEEAVRTEIVEEPVERKIVLTKERPVNESGVSWIFGLLTLMFLAGAVYLFFIIRRRMQVSPLPTISSGGKSLPANFNPLSDLTFTPMSEKEEPEIVNKKG